MARSIESYHERTLSLAYQGVDEVRPWQSLIDFLAQQTNSHVAAMNIFCPSANPARHFFVSSDHTSYHHEEFVSQAFRMVGDIFPRDNEPRNFAEIMSRERLERTELYQKVHLPRKIEHVLAYEVYRDAHVCVRLTISRQPQQGFFTNQHKDLLLKLSPHLVHAIRLRLKLQDQEGRIGVLQDSLSSMGIGVITLGANGLILESTEEADRLLAGNRGVRIGKQRLCLEDECNRYSRDTLETALSESRLQPTTLRIPSSTYESDIQLVIKPIRQNHIRARTGAVAQVFISEVGPNCRELDPRRLQEMFALTYREARLAVLIAKGCAPKEAADQLKVSINTVKTQLSSIYDKLAVRGHNKVAQLLNTSNAAIM